MEFTRQEYWNGLLCPSPGDLLDPEIESGSPAGRQILYRLSHQGEQLNKKQCSIYVYVLRHQCITERTNRREAMGTSRIPVSILITLLSQLPKPENCHLEYIFFLQVSYIQSITSLMSLVSIPTDTILISLLLPFPCTINPLICLSASVSLL